MPEAVVLCRALANDGIAAVIATPHQLGRFDGAYSTTKIRLAVADLNRTLSEQRIPLTVLPGADVRVDERIPQLLKSDHILTLADTGKYILLELPDVVFVDIEPLIEELVSLKVTPIISHPERHNALDRRPDMISKWLGHSARLQITAASLLGCFGSQVETAAWRLLRSGRVSLVATDSHDLNNRRPLMREAFKLISTRFDEDIARLVCIENPARVVKGMDLPPVRPLRLRRLEVDG
jgi:protein-tyrosine phosphatase